MNYPTGLQPRSDEEYFIFSRQNGVLSHSESTKEELVDAVLCVAYHLSGYTVRELIDAICSKLCDLDIAVTQDQELRLQTEGLTDARQLVSVFTEYQLRCYGL